MRELLPDIDAWTSAGESVALATVVKAWGSAPRPLGSNMIVSSAGEFSGSVSGGCVESAVVAEAEEVLTNGRVKLVSYGVSNELAWSVGLSCGGRIEILIERISGREKQSDLYARLVERLLADRTTIRAIAVDGPCRGRQALLGDGLILAGSLGSPDLDAEVLSHCIRDVDVASARKTIETPDGVHDVFLHLHRPRPELIIIGAVHVAIHLVALARRLGYATVVIDPRTTFATPERFADADCLLSTWPQEALADIPIHESTCFVFLSHDLKIDLPGLEVALRSPALYVGALGSTKTHARRVDALRDRGFSSEEVERISAPIGLDLGGRRAEEIALAIMAEIVAVRYRRS